MVRRLLLLNGLCALAIPIHHAAAYGLQAMFQWTDRYQDVAVPNYDQLWSLPFHVLMTTRHLMAFAVPGFLLVSGFYVAFMAGRSHATVSLGSLLPRMKILLIPFLIWTTLRFVMLYQVPTSLNGFLDTYFYIPLLFQFFLISPWLVLLAKRNWKLFLGGAGLLHLLILGLRYCGVFGFPLPGLQWFLELPRWLFFLHPLWFPMGLAIGLNSETFQQWLMQTRRFLLPLSGVLAVSILLEYQFVTYLTGRDWLGSTFGGFSRQLYGLSIILCILSFDLTFLKTSQFITRLSRDSLGIYLVNVPSIYFVAVAMYYLAPNLLGHQLTYFALLAAVGLAGPLTLMSLVKGTPARPAYRYLFG